MRNTANTSSAAALIPSMAELSKIGDRHSSDSEPVGLNDAERAMSIDDGSRSNQLPGMVSRRTVAAFCITNDASQKQTFCVTTASRFTRVHFHGFSVSFAAGNHPLRWFNPALSFVKVPR